MQRIHNRTDCKRYTIRLCVFLVRHFHLPNGILCTVLLCRAEVCWEARKPHLSIFKMRNTQILIDSIFIGRNCTAVCNAQILSSANVMYGRNIITWNEKTANATRSFRFQHDSIAKLVSNWKQLLIENNSSRFNSYNFAEWLCCRHSVKIPAHPRKATLEGYTHTVMAYECVVHMHWPGPSDWITFVLFRWR